jgi:hypothetical protein
LSTGLTAERRVGELIEVKRQAGRMAKPGKKINRGKIPPNSPKTLADHGVN